MENFWNKIFLAIPTHIAQNVAESCQKYFQYFIAIEILSTHSRKCRKIFNHNLNWIKLLKNLYDCNFTLNLVKKNDVTLSSKYRKNMVILPDQNFTVFLHL